jgi:hypothetical protein
VGIPLLTAYHTCVNLSSQTGIFHRKTAFTFPYFSIGYATFSPWREKVA